MKKITTIFAFMLLAVAFTSCDSETKDAKRLAQITCKVQELSKDPEKNMDELKKLEKEADDIKDKYEKKEKDMNKDAKDAFEKKMEKAFKEELEKCKK